MIISKEIHDIYAAMLPSLERLAAAYKVCDSGYFAASWEAEAFFIAKKFDEKEIKPKIKIGETLYGSKTHSVEFLRFFKSYLVTAFRNSLVDELRLKKRRRVFMPCFEKVGFTDPFDYWHVHNLYSAISYLIGNATPYTKKPKVRAEFLSEALNVLNQISKHWHDLPVGDANAKCFYWDFEHDFKEVFVANWMEGNGSQYKACVSKRLERLIFSADSEVVRLLESGVYG